MSTTQQVTTKTIRGHIKRLFNNCPKPDGWFGCFFRIEGTTTDIKLTGVFSKNSYPGIELRSGMKLECECEENNGEYRAVLITPINKMDLMKYLSSSSFPGVGQKLAEKLCINFGDNVLSVIENEPDKLKAIGISDAKIKILQAGVSDRSIENQLRKWIPCLSDKMLRYIVDEYKTAAKAILLSNPYQMIERFANKGIRMTFMDVDKIACAIGFAYDDKRRLDACIEHTVKTITEESGDSYICLSNDEEYRQFVSGFMKYVCQGHKYPMLPYSRIPEVLSEAKSVQVVTIDDCTLLYLKSDYYAEVNSAEILSGLLNTKPLVTAAESKLSILVDIYSVKFNQDLDDIQKQAVIQTFLNRVHILTGGPGTGKTSVLNCILWIYDYLVSHSRRDKFELYLMAPTGKACRRMMDCISDVFHECVKTVDSWLLDKCCVNDKTGKVTPGLVVCEESSMLGLRKLHHMLKKFKNCQILFVGDVDQLPSIDKGQVLKDLCDCTMIPKTVLLHCYRQGGKKLLVDNAKVVNQGMVDVRQNWSYLDESFMLYTHWDNHLVNAGYEKAYEDALISRYQYYRDKGLLASDICILCPMRKNVQGVYSLNLRLQAMYNPLDYGGPIPENGFSTFTKKGHPISGTVYPHYKAADGQSQVADNRTQLRVGDRVINTTNHHDWSYVKWYADGTGDVGTGCCNGDVGTIISYHVSNSADTDDDTLKPYVKIRMDDGREFEVDSEQLLDFELAYALTIHKSQGSEYEAILLSMPWPKVDENLYMLRQNRFWKKFLTRNLLYTAITRATNTVEIFGAYEILDFCIENELPARNSLLQYRIQQRYSYCTVEGRLEQIKERESVPVVSDLDED